MGDATAVKTSTKRQFPDGNHYFDASTDASASKTSTKRQFPIANHYFDTSTDTSASGTSTNRQFLTGHFRDIATEGSELICPAKQIQGPPCGPLRRVRVACKATFTFPHACASFISEGDWTPTEKNCYLGILTLKKRGSSP